MATRHTISDMPSIKNMHFRSRMIINIIAPHSSEVHDVSLYDRFFFGFAERDCG